MAKVSIIIPVYNSEKYIEKCICSILNQTYEDLEIIIVDDGSIDDSFAILQELAWGDERIVLLRQDNSGVAVARNNGLKHASGQYLSFVDSDDYLAADYIEQLYGCAQRTDADMVICGVTYVNEAGNILKQIIPDRYEKNKKEEWTFRLSAVWSHLYKRSLWEQYDVKFFPNARGEDMPIALFFSAMCSKIEILTEAGYYYVQHSESAMHNFRGLRTYSLPYEALEVSIKKIKQYGIVNSAEYHELFVLRILATCIFDLGRGASKEKMGELCNYIEHIINSYYPGYYKNKLARLTSKIDVPVYQKFAVWLLMKLVRFRLLHLFSGFLIR